MKWHEPKMQTTPEPKKKSKWFYVMIMLSSVICYAGLMLLITLSNENVTLFTWLLTLGVAPLCMGFAITGFFYSYYFYRYSIHLFKSAFILDKKNEWKKWAQQHAVLSASTYVTAIEKEGLKIANIVDGKVNNANVVLSIENLKFEASSRLASIITELLKPLVEQLKQKDNLSITTYSTFSETKTRNNLASFFRLESININADVDIIYSEQVPDLSILNEFIGTKEDRHHLLLILSLYNEKALNSSEFACALLFSPSNNREGSIECYRPLATTPINFEKDFSLLISSEQTDITQLRHIWTVNFNDVLFNTLAMEVSELALLPDINNIHNMNNYSGNLSMEHVWLALAFGKESIEHGQKAQIIGQQIEDSIYLLQMSKKQDLIEQKAYTNKSSFYPVSYLFSVLLFLFALCPLANNTSEQLSLFLSALVGGLFLAFLLLLLIPIKLRLLTQKHEREWETLMRESK